MKMKSYFDVRHLQSRATIHVQIQVIRPTRDLCLVCGRATHRTHPVRHETFSCPV